MQESGSLITANSPTSMSSSGHASTHELQAVQVSLLIVIAILVFPFLFHPTAKKHFDSIQQSSDKAMLLVNYTQIMLFLEKFFTCAAPGLSLVSVSGDGPGAD
jgi:hypothetical protein